MAIKSFGVSGSEIELADLLSHAHGELTGVDKGDHRTDTQIEDLVNTLLGDGVSTDIMPDSDNSRAMGTTNYRFSEVHSNSLYGTAHYADIVFQEKKCDICGEKFESGDKVQLIVNKVVDEGSEDDGSYMVPVHVNCDGE